MTQEEKELLLKDLCARLPYRVIVELDEQFRFNKGTHTLVKELLDLYCVDGIKPYLRPMSSMTEEEVKEIRKINWQFCKPKNGECYIGAAEDGYCSVSQMSDILKYLIKNHFDYLGLIPMGLALEAPKDMYYTGQKWTPLRSGLKENKDGDIVGGLMNYKEDMDLNYRDYPCESKSVDYLDVRLAIERDTKMIIQEAEISHKDNFDEFYDRDSIKPDKVRLFFDGNESPIFGMIIYKIYQKNDGYWRSACGGYYPIYNNELLPHPYQESICW